jgi:hypothetical protein
MIAVAVVYSIPVFNFLAAVASALAAYFWYRASQVQAPSGDADYGNGSNAFVDAAPLVEYARESGRRNKIAALCSAAAALFAFLSWVLGLLADPFVP